MGANLSSGTVIDVDLDSRTGLIQDDFDQNLILTFDFTQLHRDLIIQNKLPKVGDNVDYYILYNPQPTANNVLFSDVDYPQSPIVKTKFWQRSSFWFKVFCMALGMLIGWYTQSF